MTFVFGDEKKNYYQTAMSTNNDHDFRIILYNAIITRTVFDIG